MGMQQKPLSLTETAKQFFIVAQYISRKIEKISCVWETVARSHSEMHSRAILLQTVLWPFITSPQCYQADKRKYRVSTYIA
jgi:hypothetical protein